MSSDDEFRGEDVDEPLEGEYGDGDSDGESRASIDEFAAYIDEKYGSQEVDPYDVRPKDQPDGMDLSFVARPSALPREFKEFDASITEVGDMHWEDPGEEVNLYGVIVRVEDADETVIVADKTGSVGVKISEKLALEPPEPGSEVVIENVQKHQSHPAAKAIIGTEIDVIEPAEDRDSVEHQLKERSDIENARSWYKNSETEQARRRVVNAICDDYDVKHVMPTEETWMWVGETGWAPNGDARLKALLNDKLPAEVNKKHERNEITEQVQLRVQTDENPFTPGPPGDAELQWKTPVLNGLIDLREGPNQEPEPHKPEHHTRLDEVLPVTHDPDATCPRIDENLGKISSSDAMKRTLYEAIANSAMRHNDYRKTYINIGDAETGKSFMTLLLSWLFPDEGVEHMAFERLVEDDFEGAATMGSYAVIDDDSSAKKITRKQSNAFKRFLGIGGVRTGAKHQRRESHDPISTFWVNVNHVPVWEDWDDSITSRLLPLFFTNKFVNDPDPGDPRQHQKKKVSELEAELKTPGELSGLLNKVIEAANRLYETGEWSIYDEYGDDAEEAHDALMRKYRMYADTTRRFAREFMVEDEEPVRVRKNDWHTIYRRWVAEQGLEPQAPPKFWEQIRNDETTYVEFVNPYQEERSTEYVRPSKKALDYAPKPVADRVQDKIACVDVNPVDEVARISDLSMGPVPSVTGRVTKRRLITDGGAAIGAKVRIRDETGQMDVVAWGEDDENPLDGVHVGDKVEVCDGTMKRRDGAPQIEIEFNDPVEVVERGPNAEEPVEEEEEEESGEVGEFDPSNPQNDLQRDVRDIIASKHEKDGEPVPLDMVRGGATNIGYDEDRVEHVIETMKRDGHVLVYDNGVRPAWQ